MAKEKEREYEVWEATPALGSRVLYFPNGDRGKPLMAFVQGFSAGRPGELELLVFPPGRSAGSYDSQYVRTGVRHADDPCHTSGEGFELKIGAANGTWDTNPVEPRRVSDWAFAKKLDAQRKEHAERQEKLGREREAKRMEAATA